MVWIHGGGMITGDSRSIAGSNASSLALTEDVIVVSINVRCCCECRCCWCCCCCSRRLLLLLVPLVLTFPRALQYRLGPLGFFSHADIAAKGRGEGGMNGIHDQITALKWIRENIGAFGGTTRNLTVFGVSAGSLSTCSLVVSPLAKGLFAHAIMESGPCFGPWGPGSTANGLAVSARMMAELHASSVAALVALPPSHLMWSREYGQVRRDSLTATMYCELRLLSPPLPRSSLLLQLIVRARGQDPYDIEFPGYWSDGYVLPRAPKEVFASGEINPHAVLLGACSRDGVATANSTYLPLNKTAKGGDFAQNFTYFPSLPALYAPDMRQHWRPRNSTGGLGYVIRTLCANSSECPAETNESIAPKVQNDPCC